MAAAARSPALKLDWAKISSSLGLKGQTAASLAAFKKRNDDARRKVNALSAQPQTVDFAQYRSILNNQAIVDEIEGHVKAFKPKTYDVSRQLKAIEAFEAQAITSAQETKDKVDEQVKELELCLKNIREVRSWDELTVDDMAKAEPRIDEYTAKLVYRGRWIVPGHHERWGNPAII